MSFIATASGYPRPRRAGPVPGEACGRAVCPFSASPRATRARGVESRLIDQSIGPMNSQVTAMDQAHLRRALELAERGRGRVSPNPLVGAVVVRDGEIVGEGFHAELGGLHAERAALADCRERGEDPAGATMYVTLEPCAHQGRQPPCVEAILEAGIGRVVIASEDPSEKAAGRGPGILRDGGVEVEFAAGAEAAAARLLNQAFRKHARTGLPLVTLKLAMSLDGRTSDRARRLALDLRRAQPRPGPPLARRIRRDRRRHRHRPRRRPVAHRPCRGPGKRQSFVPL